MNDEQLAEVLSKLLVQSEEISGPLHTSPLPERYFYIDCAELALNVPMQGDDRLTVRKLKILSSLNFDLIPEFIKIQQSRGQYKENSRISSLLADLDDFSCFLYLTANTSTEKKVNYRVVLNDLEMMGKIATWMTEHQGGMTFMFARVGSQALDWQQKSVSDLYQQQSTDPHESTYKPLHNSLKEVILKLIYQDKPAAVNIIDGGCGNGLFLTNLAESLPADEELPLINLLGFDFNAQNIIEANARRQSKVTFVEGDLRQIDDVIATAIQKNSLSTKEGSRTILVLSGSLTRLVLSDAFVGLDILKKISRTQAIDFLIGGGVGEPLINPYIGRQIGYKKIMEPSFAALNSGLPFLYQKVKPDSYIQYKKTKLETHHIVDLALSPNPIKTFDALAENMEKKPVQVATIDISFTDISDPLIDRIRSLIQDNRNIQLVCTHSNREMLEKVERLAYRMCCPFSLYYVTAEHERYLMASQRFFNRYHKHEPLQIFSSYLPELAYPPADLTSESRIIQMLRSSGNLSFAADLILQYTCQISKFEIKNSADLEKLTSVFMREKGLKQDRKTLLHALSNCTSWGMFSDEESTSSDNEEDEGTGDENIQNIEWGYTVTSDEPNMTNFMLGSDFSVDDSPPHEQDNNQPSEAAISRFLEMLERLILENKEKDYLPILIYLRQINILLKEKNQRNSPSIYEQTSANFIAEIESYVRLAATFPTEFSQPFVHALCVKRLSEFNARPNGQALAWPNSKEWSKQKQKIADTLEPIIAALSPDASAAENALKS